MTTTITRRLRPFIKRHGGKYYLASRIVSLFPGHRVYVEPFLGGGSCLLRKPKACREVVGDLDADLIGLWGLLARRPDWLRQELAALDFDEATFEAARGMLASDNPTLRAVGYLIRNRMSRGALGKDFAKCGRLADGSPRLRGGKPDNVNAWDTIRAELPAIAERVRDVEFHCCDASTLIRSNDADDAVIYADPPYHHETRTVRKAYDHEMDGADHAALLDTLAGCRGAFFLSGYRCGMYDAAAQLHGWHRVDFDIANHSGQGKWKQRRVECVWSNRPIPGDGVDEIGANQSS
jgi:DNA adenine methylase